MKVTTPSLSEKDRLPKASDLLFANAPEKKLYWDRSHYESPESQMRALAKSSTLYVGNLAFTTRSIHVRSHFTLLGCAAAASVKKIHMGLDRFKKTPCGFCFVEYWKRKDALLAVSCLSGTKLDGRIIRVELDAGFQIGRQFGRGVSGGQVRDDRRQTDRVGFHNHNNHNKNNPKWKPPPPPGPPPSKRKQTTNETDGHYGPTLDANNNTNNNNNMAGVKRERSDDQDNHNDNQDNNHNDRYNHNDHNNENADMDEGQNRNKRARME